LIPVPTATFSSIAVTVLATDSAVGASLRSVTVERESRLGVDGAADRRVVGLDVTA
jgi:hypothetical protein